jgi:hypothetical protein
MVELADISPAEARRLTEKIRRGASQLYDLVLEAYERGAYKALGYTGWRQYVDTEFDMSPGHAGRLLMQARAVKVLTAATDLAPEDIELSARAASELGPAGVAEVAQEVARVPLVDRAVALREAIAGRRRAPDPADVLAQHEVHASEVEEVLGTSGAPEFYIQEAVGSLRQLLDLDPRELAQAYSYFLPEEGQAQKVAQRLIEWAGDFAEELGVTY